MILNALYDCYHLLENDKSCDIALKGYSRVMCSFAIVLSKTGEIKSILDLRDNKKGPYLIVPKQPGRSSNVQPYFLCDKSKYFIGVEFSNDKKKLIKYDEYLVSSIDTHIEIIGQVEDEAAQAVLMFLEKNKNIDLTQIDENNPIYQGKLIAFRYEDEPGYIHERPQVREAWEKYLNKKNSETERDGVKGQCLITGRQNVNIARTHDPIKGISGAKSLSAIVSFNDPSYKSYGKDQSYNAPISEDAMFKYTTALNYLLSQLQNTMLLGDTTVVFWTKKTANGTEIDLINGLLGGSFYKIDDKEVNKRDSIESRNVSIEKLIKSVLIKAKGGFSIDKDIEEKIDINTDTYILGLAPNSARIAIRFWYQNTLSDFINKMCKHYEDMEIEMPPRASEFVTIKDILKTMAVLGDIKNIPASLERGLLQAILSGGQYPQTVYNTILMRIRNEAGDDEYIAYKDRIRAGFLKAYLRRYYRTIGKFEKEEEMTVSLNQESRDVAYNLGRLFAVLERLQADANNGNTTIRSRYFSSASTMPRVVFPTLLNLAQHHISKSEYGVYYDKEIESILDRIDNGFPANLSLEEQGTFVLGFYHQKQFSFKKKEDK